jgi:hypothetical protein
VPTFIVFLIDNCWRENKNRYVLAFLASLVELNVFVEAGIDFLIKGHTGMFYMCFHHKNLV